MKKTITKTTPKKTTKPIPKKVLTKGLDAIFGEDISKIINNEDTDKNQVIEVLLTKIVTNPYQPRRVFDKEKLTELSNSIKTNGLLMPIVLKKSSSGKYYIIAGERRFRASKLANLTKIKAIVTNVSDKKMQELALIENIQREDLNAIEEATAISKLINDHKITHEEAAKVLGKSRTYITNSLRLLKLDEKIIDSVLLGKLTFGHAKPLVSLDVETSIIVFNRIMDEKLNVREVENIVRGYKLRDSRKNSTKKVIKKSAEIEYAESLVRNVVRSKVEITDKKIIIKYKGNSQLNRILERLNAIEK